MTTRRTSFTGSKLKNNAIEEPNVGSRAKIIDSIASTTSAFKTLLGLTPKGAEEDPKVSKLRASAIKSSVERTKTPSPEPLLSLSKKPSQSKSSETSSDSAKTRANDKDNQYSLPKIKDTMPSMARTTSYTTQSKKSRTPVDKRFSLTTQEFTRRSLDGKLDVGSTHSVNGNGYTGSVVSMSTSVEKTSANSDDSLAMYQATNRSGARNGSCDLSSSLRGSLVQNKFRKEPDTSISTTDDTYYADIDPDWKPADMNSFSIYKMIGKGAFSKVYLCRRRLDGKVFALKSMRKEQIVKMRQVEHVHNEKQLMTEAYNPFITKLYWTLQDPIHLFMIIEYLGGGDMFNHIKNHGRFPDDAAKFYAGEIYMGLSLLHKQDIVYRDLKPENVLLDFDGHVKLADFGFAKQIPGTTKTFCGTPSYIAPEVILRHEYEVSVDWWAFGILIFEMLSGCSPFQDETSRKTYDRIVTGRIRWPPSPSKYFSDEADDIITSLLVFNPLKRLGYEDDEEIKQHEWFNGLDWEALEARTLKPPVTMVRSVRRRSESVRLPDKSVLGSGDLGLRIGNKELEGKYGSEDLIGPLGSEIQLSHENLQGEKSWGGNAQASSASQSNLFVDF